jgi:hypothetical protein
MTANTFLFALQVHLLKLHYTLAFLAAAATSTTINFGFCKVVVFERKGKLRPFFLARIVKAEE